MSLTSPALKKKVLVVDDHAIVRTGLAALINGENDLEICGDAENERDAHEAVARLLPDVAVVDWSLKNTEAADMITAMRQNHPNLPVLVLSIHDEVHYADRALRAGASGYVMKREAADKIVEAIRCVAKGRLYLSERATDAMTELARKRLGNTSFAETLTPQGQAVLLDGKGAWVARVPARPNTVKVSIVIPVYNSESTIEHLAQSLIDDLRNTYHLQMVLVDDGSRDNSVAALHRIYEKHPDIVDVVVLSKNFGEHNAVMAGLNCVEGDYCVIMDDDFQNPPSEVKKLVTEISQGYDVVYTRYETMKHSRFRTLGSRFHNWMATYALKKPGHLYLSSFKILSRFVVREAINYVGPDPYLDAIVLRATRRLSCVTVRHDARKQGRSGYTLAKLIGLWANMFVGFSLYPLRVLAVLGILTAFAALVGALYIASTWILPVADAPPNSMWTAMAWLFGGVMVLSIGVVGEYVGRIHKYLSRDPQFLVRTLLKHRPHN